MSEQIKFEWLEETKKGAVEYHERQWQAPYRSTVRFCEHLESLKYIESGSSLKLCDMCCGEGANIFYMSSRYPSCNFKGIDINPDLVANGNEKLVMRGVPNAHLEVGDVYELKSEFRNNFDGIVMYQTLSWLPEYKTPLEKIAELNPRWLALSSLFFDGEVNCRIETEDYTQPMGGKPYKKSFYNIYSIKLVSELLRNLGYNNIHYVPFDIDIDLPKPAGRGMGTYTEKLANGGRLQISGPILMSWYFIFASK